MCVCVRGGGMEVGGGRWAGRGGSSFFVGPVRQNFHFPADFGQFLAGGSNLTPP